MQTSWLGANIIQPHAFLHTHQTHIGMIGVHHNSKNMILNHMNAQKCSMTSRQYMNAKLQAIQMQKNWTTNMKWW